MSGLDALLHRPEQESFWSRLRRSPAKVLAEYIYTSRAVSQSPASNSIPIQVVCISDTHNTKPNLPDGDILIHAGDLTQSGSRLELEEQIEWLNAQPHRYKVVIAGNHELCLDSQLQSSRTGTSSGGDAPDTDSAAIDWKSLVYLENTSTVLNLGNGRNIKVFGSPCTPKHGNWAFQYPRSNAAIWDEISIPDDTDILITHGPPKAHLDLGHFGCLLLRRTLWGMKQRPLLHVFGHIHGGYGKEVVLWDSFQRAYETVMDGESRGVGLMSLVYSWMMGWLTGWGTKNEQATVMVNAAAVGGVRDEKRRDAVCVDI
ncbi:hypothetical protein ASPVEDRAFT_45081 [Aspergillus versicolor CBS 583.65]|uniref:Calcineurin-like phosphoesterase domain-containing protein n=1 Tax=Aspergillus versicolor CBS 583.65 TaxID=1036611 RepID=A0A1L9PVJ5_ASPVE|nr:uncharacterized protein ASPVEDRAFT_45081 [Aspergillus versicolor CBS 583.65]OJJ05574.1 hypothetical protein ASPVEDRAFT_45081 [Aspergillus versicolor CBS 583.65]